MASQIQHSLSGCCLAGHVPGTTESSPGLFSWSVSEELPVQNSGTQFSAMAGLKETSQYNSAGRFGQAGKSPTGAPVHASSAGTDMHTAFLGVAKNGLGH